MGHKQSSIGNSKAVPETPLSGDSGKVPHLSHACVLQGLSGSGRSRVQHQLGIVEGKKLEVDVRFLTTPEIFSAHWGGNNFPTYGSRRELDQTLWSYGGRGSIRARWQTAAFHTKAIIFCVDSTDRARLTPAPGFQPLPNEFVAAFTHRSAEEQMQIQRTLEKTMDAKTTLHKLLAHYELRRKPLLVLATKQDQPGAMSVEEICQLLDLPSITKRDWRIAGCDAVRGEGLRDSVDWLHYIVANPTDWSAQEKAEQLSQAAMEAQWAEEEAARKVQEEARRKRDARLAKGHVLRAPPVFHTDGTLWHASEEQKRVFVVAPLTPEEEAAPAQEPAPQAAVAVGEVQPNQPAEQPAATMPVPAETSDEPLETSDVPAVQVVPVASTDVQVEGVPVEGVPSAAGKEAADAQAEAWKLLAEVAKTLEGNLHEGQTPAAAVEGVVKQPAETSTNPVPRTAAKFAVLSSTHVVLPAKVSPPPVQMKKFKKHWYSRTKMVPVDEVTNIHQRGGGMDMWFD